MDSLQGSCTPELQSFLSWVHAQPSFAILLMNKEGKRRRGKYFKRRKGKTSKSDRRAHTCVCLKKGRICTQVLQYWVSWWAGYVGGQTEDLLLYRISCFRLQSNFRYILKEKPYPYKNLYTDTHVHLTHKAKSRNN